MEMPGDNLFRKVEKAEEAGPRSMSSSSSSSFMCVHNKTGNVISPRGGPLQAENEKLKALLIKRDAENDVLKTLLAEKIAENEVLKQKISRLEGELVWEIEASGDTFLEAVKMKEVIDDKEAEMKQLRKELRRERIQNHLRTAADKTFLMTPPHQVPQIRDGFMSQDEKVLHLFPDVLKIIIDKERKYKGCTHWLSILPVLTTCRRVCKSWKRAVDLIMQQDSSQIDLFENDFFPPWYKQDFTPYPLKLSYRRFDIIRWFNNIDTISRRQKKNPSFNPVPTRHLLLEPGIEHDSEKWRKYCKAVKRYLQVLGKQVWYLTLTFGGSDDKPRDIAVVYNLLPEWLSLLPNLRSLSLYSRISPSPIETSKEYKNYFGKFKFPTLKHLVTFQGFRDTPLAYNILRSNRHIKKLGFLSIDKNSVPSASVLELDFSNLSKFSCDFEKLEDWEKFGKVTWKLEELSVNVRNFISLTPTQFTGVVEKFGNTLKILTFNLSKVETRNGEVLKLNLPHLKSLHLVSESWEGEELEGILVPLENLEEFSLELAVLHYPRHLQYPTVDEKETFLDYVNNFQDKTNWNKLLKLRNVRLTVKFNGCGIGEEDVVVAGRQGMSSVRFDIVKIDECHIEYDD